MTMDITERLRYGATCPVSAPGGDIAADMKEAADEIERLRKRVADLERLKDHYKNSAFNSAEKAGKLAIDADRYRHIRKQTSVFQLLVDGVDTGLAGEWMDAEIDAAIAECGERMTQEQADRAPK